MAIAKPKKRTMQNQDMQYVSTVIVVSQSTTAYVVRWRRYV